MVLEIKKISKKLTRLSISTVKHSKKNLKPHSHLGNGIIVTPLVLLNPHRKTPMGKLKADVKNFPLNYLIVPLSVHTKSLETISP